MNFKQFYYKENEKLLLEQHLPSGWITYSGEWYAVEKYQHKKFVTSNPEKFGFENYQSIPKLDATSIDLTAIPEKGNIHVSSYKGQLVVDISSEVTEAAVKKLAEILKRVNIESDSEVHLRNSTLKNAQKVSFSALLKANTAQKLIALSSEHETSFREFL